MHMLVAVFIVSVLWLCPVMSEAGTTGDQPPEQRQTLTRDSVKLIQERLKAERVYAGPVDGELNAQTEAALRQYQEKQGIPVSGAADEATLKELQIELPTTPEGQR
jgi:peptidoglycan hydrolase-like protein with peptidoglycan-binding domain